jgi:hypothetical protein
MSSGTPFRVIRMLGWAEIQRCNEEWSDMRVGWKSSNANDLKRCITGL